MGTFTLIPPMSLGNLNKAEKLSLLKRYMKLMPSGSDSESPDEISLLADSRSARAKHFRRTGDAYERHYR